MPHNKGMWEFCASWRITSKTRDFKHYITLYKAKCHNFCTALHSSFLWEHWSLSAFHAVFKSSCSDTNTAGITVSDHRILSGSQVLIRIIGKPCPSHCHPHLLCTRTALNCTWICGIFCLPPLQTKENSYFLLPKAKDQEPTEILWIARGNMFLSSFY